MESHTVYSSYFEKQNAFVTLMKDVQISLNSKKYKVDGYSFKDYIKMRWNISQAQAYRYLICAKVLDQLEEFEIKPSYERLCRSLNNIVKTPVQMKLLWSTILKKTNGIPDSIHSSEVTKIWNELCKNETYSHICYFEDDIITKIEKSLNKRSNEKKHKQINSTKTTLQKSNMPSPVLSEQLLSISSSELGFNEPLQCTTTLKTSNSLNIPLSPVSDCSSISTEENKTTNHSYGKFDSITIPSDSNTQNLWYQSSLSFIKPQEIIHYY